MTDYKANILSSNFQDEEACIAVIVDEIWDVYDIDNSGELDKDEMRKFVQEFMPEINPDF